MDTVTVTSQCSSRLLSSQPLTDEETRDIKAAERYEMMRLHSSRDRAVRAKRMIRQEDDQISWLDAECKTTDAEIKNADIRIQKMRREYETLLSEYRELKDELNEKQHALEEMTCQANEKCSDLECSPEALDTVKREILTLECENVKMQIELDSFCGKTCATEAHPGHVKDVRGQRAKYEMLLEKARTQLATAYKASTLTYRERAVKAAGVE